MSKKRTTEDRAHRVWGMLEVQRLMQVAAMAQEKGDEVVSARVQRDALDHLSKIWQMKQDGPELIALRAQLWYRLWIYAWRRGVTVTFSTMPLTAKNCGDRHYHKCTCACSENSTKIVIMSPTHWFNPYILAHEIAHIVPTYVVHEHETDRRAKRLVYRLTSPQEREIIRGDVQHFLVEHSS